MAKSISPNPPKSDNSSFEENRTRVTHSFLVGMQNVIAALEDGLAVSYKPEGVLVTLPSCLTLHRIHAHAMTSPRATRARPLGG